jgi:hypothetical protein
MKPGDLALLLWGERLVVEVDVTDEKVFVKAQHAPPFTELTSTYPVVKSIRIVRQRS